MKNQRKTEIKVGLTTILGLLVFLWILGWAKDIKIFSEELTLRVKFDSVSGLEIGDRVTVNGLRKGYVEDIETSGVAVLVTMNLEGNTNLKKDAAFSLMILDLMGGKKVEIQPGVSEEPLDLNEIHEGVFVGDMSTAMAALSSVQKDLTDIIYETKKTLISLNEFFGDKNLKSQIKSTVTNLNSLTSKISKMADENRNGLKKLIDTGNKLAENANNLIEENDETLKLTIETAREMLENSNKLVTQIEKITTEIIEKENNAGKLLYDRKLVEDLKISINQIKELTQILIEQLKDEGINVDAHIF